MIAQAAKIDEIAKGTKKEGRTKKIVRMIPDGATESIKPPKIFMYLGL